MPERRSPQQVRILNFTHLVVAYIIGYVFELHEYTIALARLAALAIQILVVSSMDLGGQNVFLFIMISNLFYPWFFSRKEATIYAISQGSIGVLRSLDLSRLRSAISLSMFTALLFGLRLHAWMVFKWSVILFPALLGIMFRRYVWEILRLAYIFRPRFSARRIKDWIGRLREPILARRLQPFAYPSTSTPDYLRLMKVERWHAGVLYCTLEQFSLNDCPPYTALSYTWAEPKRSILEYIWSLYHKDLLAGQVISEVARTGRLGPPSSWTKSANEKSPEMERSYKAGEIPRNRLVVCNGCALYMTQNLYNALVCIPSSTQHLETYWWIDQLCIDHSNANEKNIQVQRMGEIFSRAANVVAWLGLPSLFETNASVALSNLSASTAGPSSQTNPNFKMEDLLAVLTVLNRPWFERVWIVQEFIFAKDITFFLGDMSISSDHLFGAARTILRLPIFYKGINVDFVPAEATQILLDARTSNISESGYSLEQWLQISRSHRAWDSKDLLYAGLSLLSQTERERIVVDYSKTSEDLFLDVSRNLLISDMGVEALALADRGTYSRSWLKSGRISWELNVAAAIDSKPLSKSDYSADFTKSISTVSTDNFQSRSSLQVDGFILDKVEKIVNIPATLELQNLDVLVEIILSVGTWYEWTNEHPLVAVARTFTVDKSSKAGLGADYITTKFVVLIATLFALSVPVSPRPSESPQVHTPKGTPDNYRTAYNNLRNSYPNMPKLPWDQSWNALSGNVTREELNGRHNFMVHGRAPSADDEYIPLMLLGAKGRSFFMTQKGILGMGPLSTEPGDQVLILKGSRVPFLFTSNPQYRNDKVDVNNIFEEYLECVKVLQNLMTAAPPQTVTIKRSDLPPADKVENFLTWFKNSQIYRNQLEIDSSLRRKWSLGAIPWRKWQEIETLLREFKQKCDACERLAIAMDHTMRLKGEAYLHGFMYGEAANLMQEESLVWQTITIR